MAGPVSSFLNRASELAASAASGAKSAVAAVAEKVDDHIDTIRGGNIRIPVSVVNGLVVIDPTSSHFIEINPADYDRI